MSPRHLTSSVKSGEKRDPLLAGWRVAAENNLRLARDQGADDEGRRASVT